MWGEAVVGTWELDPAAPSPVVSTGPDMGLFAWAVVERTWSERVVTFAIGLPIRGLPAKGQIDLEAPSLGILRSVASPRCWLRLHGDEPEGAGSSRIRLRGSITGLDVWGRGWIELDGLEAYRRITLEGDRGYGQIRLEGPLGHGRIELREGRAEGRIELHASWGSAAINLAGKVEWISLDGELRSGSESSAPHSELHRPGSWSYVMAVLLAPAPPSLTDVAAVDLTAIFQADAAELDPAYRRNAASDRYSGGSLGEILAPSFSETQLMGILLELPEPGRHPLDKLSLERRVRLAAPGAASASAKAASARLDHLSEKAASAPTGSAPTGSAPTDVQPLGPQSQAEQELSESRPSPVTIWIAAPSPPGAARRLASRAFDAVKASLDIARSSRAAFTARTMSALVEAPEAIPAALPSPAPTWVTAYRPSWILPRRQSSVHIYVFMPEASVRVRKEAHAALDAAGNPARASHAISLHRAPDPREPLVVHVALPGFEVGQPAPMPWRPPYVRFVVSILAPADVALGVHRPLVTVRSGYASGELLSTFDFDLCVRQTSPRASRARGALSAGGVALALAIVTLTEQHALPPGVGWPFGAVCLAGGASAWAMMRPSLGPAEVRDRHLRPWADVLIVTAVKEEYQAVLAVDTGAVRRSSWEKRTGSTRMEVAFRDFVTDRGALRIAVTQALGMGGVSAVNAAAQLLQDYSVRCLSMCGVCAGRRGDVALGDVIVADRLWQYDTGKRKVQVGENGQRAPGEQGDIDMVRIQPPEWLHAAERFQVGHDAPWLALRPRSYEAQGDWILERILRDANPASDPDQAVMCADYAAALTRLWRRGLLRDGELALTDAGRAHIRRLLARHCDKLPEPRPLEIRVGPIASGNKVMEDEEIFPLLSDDVRKVLGVEMEAEAIGALAHAAQIPYSVIMKAVMDHADPDKSDNFKPFAARASAECLIEFLRAHLPPRERPVG